jgi:hypothetical protein
MIDIVKIDYIFFLLKQNMAGIEPKVPNLPVRI